MSVISPADVSSPLLHTRDERGVHRLVLNRPAAFNVLGEATRYCVLMILMAIICFQAPSLASALTGGAAIQQVIQMIQNAMMVSGLRSASSARGASAAAGAGGVIRAGTGLPHAAASMARRGYGAARSAAYRLAALRGRS